MRIASVISESDVSHNGLFIGLWTCAEVSLGFIVACSLCLPKLIQVKGKTLRQSLSWPSSKGRKSSLWSGSRRSGPHDSHDAQGTKPTDGERPDQNIARKDYELQAKAASHPVRDMYALPSTAGSSEYSQSVYSQGIRSNRASVDDGSNEVATIARQEIPRSISVRTQEVPVCLMATDLSPRQFESERKVLQEFNFETFRVTIDTDLWRERP